MSESIIRGRRFGARLVAVTLLSVMLVGLPVSDARLATLGKTYAGESETRPGDDDLDALSALERAFQVAAEGVSDSVVSVIVDLAPARQQQQQQPPQQQRRRMQIPGMGGNSAYQRRPDLPASGVIIGADGIIATAASLVAPANREVRSIEVVLADGRRLKAERLGLDENTDVALLKVDAKDLPAAKIGDSAALVPGRFVVAVARSEGLVPHVTTGIISAVKRFKGNSFQLDALVNYASSGAAVVDLDGRLVGIVCRVVPGARSGQSSGVGFAAPLHKLNEVRGDLLAGKVIEKVKGPFLGIRADQETREGKGVVIGATIEGTAAASAGLAAGDVITIFNGVELEDFAQLADEIGRLKPGDEILLTVQRDGWERDFTIKLGARPDGQ